MMGVREDIVAAARSYLGVPYKGIYQGTGPEDGGFTCSGLAWRAYSDAGLDIPICQGIHSYYTGSWNGWNTQAGWVLTNGHCVYDADALQPGDLVFYSPVGDPERTGHVAIYAGGGKIIHANGHPVSCDPLSYGGWFTHGGWPLRELPDSGDSGGEWFSVATLLRFRKRTPIRSKPDGTNDGNIVGHYAAGDTCLIDRVYLNETDRVWGSYLGQSSGKRRYVSLGTHEVVEVVA
jgi:cell wall-associated NlpC family hydrolase